MQREDVNVDRTSRAVRFGALAVVLLAVTLAFARALGGELVYDDLWLVARNPALENFDELAESLRGAHWDFVEPDTAMRIGYWRPLAMFALYAARQLGDGSPVAYHAFSLVFHLASTVFVFLLVSRWFEPRQWIAPLAAAAVFGLHPVHVESVAWISALNDPMGGCFVLASLWLFVRWRQAGSSGAPIAATLCFALGLFTKESSLAWFVLAPLADWATRVDSRPLVRAYAPAFAVVALYWFARTQVFDHWLGGFDRVTSYLHESTTREITLRVELLGSALALLVWPAQLNLFREVRPEIPWSDATLWIAIAALTLWLSAVIVAARRKQTLLVVGLTMMLAAYAPAAMRYESIGRFPLSERFLYLSVLGCGLVAAWCVSKMPRAAAWAAIASIAVASGVQSFARTAVWRDELALFRDGVEKSPRSMYVHWGLGRVLLDRFQKSSDVTLLPQAFESFTKAQDLAVERDPAVLDTLFDELQSSLGVGWYLLFCALHTPDECTLDEAEMVFRTLSSKATTSAEARCGLGMSLRFLGRLDEAETELRKGLEFNPRHHESWFNLGRISLERQKWNDALEQFQRCVELAPDDVDAWVSLGMAAVELGLGDRARSALARARALAPESTEPLIQLGVMAAREQRFEVALEFFEQVLKLKGSHGPAHLLRAKCLMQLQRTNEALAAFNEASRWLQEPSRDPERARQTFEAFYNAGVLTLQRSPKDALPMLEEALRRDPDGVWSPGLRAEVETLREHVKQS